MERLKSISFSTKALLVASGVVVTSVGAYFLYKKLQKNQDGEGAKVEGETSETMCKRQPSENIDDSEINVQQQGTKVLVLGLEKSGKTCLLAAMTNEENERQYQPTLGFNIVCITNIGERLDIMEIGGSDLYKKHWVKFLKDTSILLYVIDSCEKGAIPSALDALKELLGNKELANIPVVIVFSKRDHDSAVPTEEMIMEVKEKQLEDSIFQYASVQVRCGGAPETSGVLQLQETLVQLCRNSST